jgi:hypothetical protein
MYILKIQQIFFGEKENMIHDGVSTYLGVGNGAMERLGNRCLFPVECRGSRSEGRPGVCLIQKFGKRYKLNLKMSVSIINAQIKTVRILAS